MRASTDPHNTLWTRDDRNPVTLPLIGRCGPGLRYQVHRFGDPLPVAPKPITAPIETRRGKAEVKARRWSPQEDAQLQELRAQGHGFPTIALKLRRHEGSCRKRMLWLKERNDE